MRNLRASRKRRGVLRTPAAAKRPAQLFSGPLSDREEQAPVRKINPDLEVLLAIVVLILAPIWLIVPALAGVILYRRYWRHKHLHL